MKTIQKKISNKIYTYSSIIKELNISQTEINIQNIEYKKQNIELINKDQITCGLSGDKVYKLFYTKDYIFILKSSIMKISKLPTEKDFLKYLVFKNKYSLLRELINNIILAKSKKYDFFPTMIKYNIQYINANKNIQIDILYEYIKGFNIKDIIINNPINITKKDYIYMYYEFFTNLHLLYNKYEFIHNDFKDDNMIIKINKKNKPQIFIIDFGSAIIKNIPFKTLRTQIQNKFHNHYKIYYKFKSKSYNNRTLKQIKNNTNKSHIISSDIKFILITFIQGYRHLFGNSSDIDFTTVNIKNINNINDYGKKLEYIITKIKNIKLN